MQGEILLKMVSQLTPDDVRRMKAAGCEDGVRDLLEAFDGLTVSWRSADFGPLHSNAWDNIEGKLDELWAALCEG